MEECSKYELRVKTKLSSGKCSAFTQWSAFETLDLNKFLGEFAEANIGRFLKAQNDDKAATNVHLLASILRLYADSNVKQFAKQSKDGISELLLREAEGAVAQCLGVLVKLQQLEMDLDVEEAIKQCTDKPQPFSEKQQIVTSYLMNEIECVFERGEKPVHSVPVYNAFQELRVYLKSRCPKNKDIMMQWDRIHGSLCPRITIHRVIDQYAELKTSVKLQDVDIRYVVTGVPTEHVNDQCKEGLLLISNLQFLKE